MDYFGETHAVSDVLDVFGRFFDGLFAGFGGCSGAEGAGHTGMGWWGWMQWLGGSVCIGGGRCGREVTGVG